MTRSALRLLSLLSLLVMSSCNVTRRLPEGSYIVNDVKIETDKQTPRKERISSSELEQYIRQTPNRRFISTHFYVWLYQSAKPEKDNWWNNFKRRVGEEPIILDMTQTLQSERNLKTFMDSKGYFQSEASYQVDTTSHYKKASITYQTKQNTAWRIDSISYDFRDEFLEQIIMPDTVNSLLKTGQPFDISQLSEERSRISSLLRNKGYFNFTVNNIEYLADTLNSKNKVDLTMVIKRNLTGYNEQGNAIMENNTIYRLRNINILPDYDPTLQISDSLHRAQLDTMYYRGLNIIYKSKANMRSKTLRSAVPLYPNYLYQADLIARTYTDIMSLGFFRSAKVSFTEVPADQAPNSIVSYISADGVLDTTNTIYTRESYLDCNILCTPSLKQSFKVDFKASTTSSFYGLLGTVGYQNRNIFRGAEALDISFTAGYEFMRSLEASQRQATEFGGSIGLSLPKFLLPFSTVKFSNKVNLPRTRLEFSVNTQNRPYYNRTLSSASLGYTWSNYKYSSFSIKPIDINLVDVSDLDQAFWDGLVNEYLKNSYKTQLIPALTFGYVYNNQNKNPWGNSTLIRFNAESAGNLFSGIQHLFSKPNAEGEYEILGIPFSQYVRTDLSISRKFALGDKTAIVGRLYGGIGNAYGNSSSIPIDRLFYAGGSNSMRGWAPRTLGPGSVPEPTDVIYPIQVADMKLEANLELRFPIWGIFHGATFLDLGNIWYTKSNPEEYSEEAVFKADNFYRQLGFNTGLGLRLDITFAVICLDWGIQLHNPNKPVGERWIHDFNISNTALNFGVGYPF